MKSFSEKIFSGEPVNSEEWTTYLQRAHERQPGMTSLGTGLRCNDEGLNSYQILAGAIVRERPETQRVLDLACGDGHLFSSFDEAKGRFELVGVDMSPDELALAKGKTFRHPTRFRLAMAHQTAEESNSFDAITCHMAFMLMMPMEPVIDEIFRLLKPKGQFAALSVSTRPGAGFETVFMNLRHQYFLNTFPNFKRPKLGDDRVYNLEGLRRLFTEDRFHELQLRPLNLHSRYPASQVWSHFKSYYLVSLMPEKNQAELQQLIESAALKEADSGGFVSFNFQYDLFIVEKRA
jgi:ubiquinone/menaquinone biosynthesis C-methylase UbiE